MAIGAPKSSGAVYAAIPDEGTTEGRIEAGISNSRKRSLSQERELILKSILMILNLLSSAESRINLQDLLIMSGLLTSESNASERMSVLNSDNAELISSKTARNTNCRQRIYAVKQEKQELILRLTDK